MPRFSVLARHFGVSQERVAEAVNQLAARGLVRREPDGRFSRSSPAEYHIPLSAGACLQTSIVPVSGALTCRAKTVGREKLRDDVAWALSATAGEAGCVLKAQYADGDELAALSATYVTVVFRPLLDKLALEDSPELLPLGAGPLVGHRGPEAVQLEMQQPSAGVAGLMRLAPGEKAVPPRRPWSHGVTFLPKGNGPARRRGTSRSALIPKRCGLATHVPAGSVGLRR
jgi:Bacterial regulatory proteins, gntR family